jgi:putative nucleotidyltransferase with HDIG domain
MHHIIKRASQLTLLQRFALTSLLVFVALGVALGYLLNGFIVDTALQSARNTAFDTLHGRLVGELRPADLAKPMTGHRYSQFQRFVEQRILSRRTVRVKIWNRQGVVIYSDDRSIVGKHFEAEDELNEALRGELASDVSNLSRQENLGDRRHFSELLEVYLPIRFGNGPVVGAFEVYQDYAPVAAEIASARRNLFGLLGSGLLVLYLTLFGIVRRASRTIVAQQRDLRRYTAELEASYNKTIASLAAAVDARDASTEQHSARVTDLAVELGRWLGLSDEKLQQLRRGALLHDVGKIGVADAILRKPGSLTEAEWQEMRRHPEIGYRILSSVSFLEDALPVVLHHHERWDGSGYPRRLAGEEIPLLARLFAVIDAYDAITSDRPYRAGASHREAVVRLEAGAGTHFDPAMVEAFIAMMEARPDLANTHPGLVRSA